MKVFALALSALLSLFCFIQSAAALSSTQSTFYVRADGGTRYDAQINPAGQCDGKGDAAYPGIGVNQHCGFNDYRYLWDYGPGTYGHYKEWAMAGGDTVIIDNTKSFRVGFEQATTSEPFCNGGSGPYSCTNPTIPSGTPKQHTRILGRNFAACSTPEGQPDPTKMSTLVGGHAVSSALNLGATQYVDIECLEVTQHAQCALHGLPDYGAHCSTGYPLDDYDSNGVDTDSGTHDVLLQDMYIHGHTNSGIQGNIGGLFTANRVTIAFNGMAGWNLDDGSHDSNGVLKLSYVSIIASGCREKYPATGAFPALICYDQESAGYGDGLGTQAGYGIDVSIDHSTFAYNTQDGVDLGHVDSGEHTLSITNSLSYGNMGGQFKWGGNFTTAVFENNLAVGNCHRMSSPLPGAPNTFNLYLSDWCRAGDAVPFNFRNGGTLLMANNSFANYSPTTFDYQCWDGDCPSSVFTFENNLVRGYDDPANRDRGGQAGGPGLFYTVGTVGTVLRSNNSFFGIRGDCPAIGSEDCRDPLFVSEPTVFVDETTLDAFSFKLSPGSPAIGSGVQVSGLSTDYSGGLRPATPSRGAFEYAAATAPAQPASTPAPSGYVDGVTTSGRTAVVFGWAIQSAAPGPAKSVEVFVDGVSVGVVAPTLARQDVVNVVAPGNAAYLYSGWSFSLDTSMLPAGSHGVSAIARDNAGQTAALGNSPTFTVAAPTSPVSPSISVSGAAIMVTLSDGTVYKGVLAKQ